MQNKASKQLNRSFYNKKAAYYIFIFLAVFLIACDRWLKHLAIRGFLNKEVYLINSWFGLKFFPNLNIAFSLPFRGVWLIGVIILIIIILLYYLVFKIKNGEYKAGILIFLIILGAFSNLIDRLKYGYVIDYFDLKFFTIFNLADALIVLGVLGALLFLKKQTH